MFNTGKVIEDRDTNWIFSHTRDDGTSVYKCWERESLIKYIKPDGSTRYNDIDIFKTVEVNESNCKMYKDIIQEVVNELYQITFPYCPGDALKIYCDYPLPAKGGEIDTLAILCGLSSKPEAIPINRYFKLVDGKWVDIDLREYLVRKHEKNHDQICSQRRLEDEKECR